MSKPVAKMTNQFEKSIKDFRLLFRVFKRMFGVMWQPSNLMQYLLDLTYGLLRFGAGSIVEQGTHTALMKQRGLYHELFTKQAEGYRG